MHKIKLLNKKIKRQKIKFIILRFRNKQLKKEMPMKYSLPQDLQPSEQTLQTIRMFARLYEPVRNNQKWALDGITLGIA